MGRNVLLNTHTVNIAEKFRLIVGTLHFPSACRIWKKADCNSGLYLEANVMISLTILFIGESIGMESFRQNAF